MVIVVVVVVDFDGFLKKFVGRAFVGFAIFGAQEGRKHERECQGPHEDEDGDGQGTGIEALMADGQQGGGVEAELTELAEMLETTEMGRETVDFERAYTVPPQNQE